MHGYAYKVLSGEALGIGDLHLAVASAGTPGFLGFAGSPLVRVCLVADALSEVDKAVLDGVVEEPDALAWLGVLPSDSGDFIARAEALLGGE